MRKKKNKTPAVVFGLFETGLGVVRSLGIKSIPVIGIDFKKDIGRYSRYCNQLICPHPIEEEKQFVKWVLQTFIKEEEKLPVFLTTDSFAFVIAKNWETFQNIFLINWIDFDFLEKISNKYEQYCLFKDSNTTVPKSTVYNNYVDFDVNLLDEHKFPVIIKGLDVNKWRKKISGTLKGFKEENKESAKLKIIEILQVQCPLLVQDIIEGPDDRHFKYCVYIGKNGEIKAEFTLQKIRQNPIKFGVGSSVKSVYNEDLIKEGRELFSKINYRGIASVEFKLDKAGRFQLIEINPRYWQQNYLSTFCGINFPYLNYVDIVGEGEIKYSNTFDENVKWINIYMDIDSFLQYRKEGTLSLRSYLKSLKGKKVFSDFIWRDPLPSLYEINFGLKIFKIPVYLYKKLFTR